MDIANSNDSENTQKVVQHHQQFEFCKTRPPYRQGRKLTSVKVYTINLESQHLFIYGVPKINLRNELKSLCIKYGKLLNIHAVEDHKRELFTECFHVHYERIQSARIAKRLLDNKSFFGGILHVCYAPEFESLHETRNKLYQRVNDVQSRINDNYKALINLKTQNNLKLEEYIGITKSQIKKKRKYPDNDKKPFNKIKIL